MTIEKLPSGNYRIKQMANGVWYRIVIDHKPSKKEATILLGEEMKQRQEKKQHSTSFAKAYLDYAESHSNTLSPSTLRGYESCFRNIPTEFTKMSIYDIDNECVQKFVNQYKAGHSPKSTRNMYGFILVVLKFKNPNCNIKVALPDTEEKDLYIPSDEDVGRILDKAKGTEYEVPLLLASYGLRRGEICALTVDDLDGNELTINKDIVQMPKGESNSKTEWVVKPPKTRESNRTIFIDDRTAELIRQQGYVYNGFPGNIGRALSRWQNELDIPHFSLHKMRHYFATKTHSMGISDADVKAMGGWKRSSDIMERVYRHENKKSVSEGKLKYAEMIAGINKI